MGTEAKMSGGKVVHVLSGMPYDLYIGRALSRYGLHRSFWANPWRIGENRDRAEALRCFEETLRTNAAEAFEVYERSGVMLPYLHNLLELRGKTLACWCAPKDRALTLEDEEICHGQVLLRLAEEITA